jgi:hypothetical protein
VSEEKAADVGPSGIEVAYERIGDPQAPPVLAIEYPDRVPEFMIAPRPGRGRPLRYRA